MAVTDGKTPCDQCPWRLSNHGKRSPGGFYTKANLLRLWNEIRKAAGGGHAQSCHLTDPSHPDHVAAGASENAKPKECPGSVILIMREIALMANEEGVIDDQSVDNYLNNVKRGLTKRGILHWAIGRYQFGGVPMLGSGPPLPTVDVDDKEIGLPLFIIEERQNE